LHYPPFAPQLHDDFAEKNDIQNDVTQKLDRNEWTRVNGTRKQMLLVGIGDRTLQSCVYRKKEYSASKFSFWH
jgi:hypothetical protein